MNAENIISFNPRRAGTQLTCYNIDSLTGKVSKLGCPLTLLPSTKDWEMMDFFTHVPEFSCSTDRSRHCDLLETVSHGDTTRTYLPWRREYSRRAHQEGGPLFRARRTNPATFSIEAGARGFVSVR